LFQETIPILAEDTFAILGDRQSVEILGAASTGFLSTDGIPNQTKKQYYVRLKRLVDIGLIEKQHRTYKLTSFGSIVYENHVKTMDKIIPNYWQIKSFDILTSLRYAPDIDVISFLDESLHKMKQLIDSIIEKEADLKYVPE
jgi:hypothetical protein